MTTVVRLVNGGTLNSFHSESEVFKRRLGYCASDHCRVQYQLHGVVDSAGHAMFSNHFARAKVECEVREWTVVYAAFVSRRMNLRETLGIRRGSISAGHTIAAKSSLGAKDLRCSQSATNVKWRRWDQMVTTHDSGLSESNDQSQYLCRVSCEKPGTELAYGLAPWYSHSSLNAFSYVMTKYRCQGKKCPYEWIRHYSPEGTNDVRRSEFRLRGTCAVLGIRRIATERR